MPVRELVRIDDEKCNGCGDCVTACAEGAIQIVDGKAKLVKDIYCDGLGACLGHCPEGAITIERVEARPFDEAAVEQHLAKLGVHASVARPRPQPLPMAPPQPHAGPASGGCPGSRVMTFDRKEAAQDAPAEAGTRPSELRQWPVQLHLVSPQAPYFQGADVLLAADCVGFSVGDFHRDHLKGNSLAIACPKLDQGQEVYVSKLVELIDEARINTLTVMVMEVPCCSGLLGLAQMAAERAGRRIPIKRKTVDVRGAILEEEWVANVG